MPLEGWTRLRAWIFGSSQEQRRWTLSVFHGRRRLVAPELELASVQGNRHYYRGLQGYVTGKTHSRAKVYQNEFCTRPLPWVLTE